MYEGSSHNFRGCRTPGAKGALLSSFLALTLLFLAPGAQAATPAFVQVNAATPQTPQSSVAVAYSAAQAAGDLNVVIVGWYDTTSSISAVTDSLGNAYSLAIGPTRGSNSSQSIYYAKNVKAGSNTVTVKFAATVAYPDVRILEYKGVDTTAPLDVTAGAAGSAATASSGSATTHNAGTLVVGGGTTSGRFTGAGAGLTSRIITSQDGDIAEDSILSATGSTAATATVSGNWVLQMAAFKGAVAGAAVSFSPTTLSFPAQALGTTSAVQYVTVTNTGSAALTMTEVLTGDFAWGGTGTCGPSLAAGASCTFSIKFIPTANGTRTGTIVVTDNAANSPQTISLTGTGGTISGPVVSFSPSTLTFGSQAVATTSAIQTVTVTNTGNATLTMTETMTGDFAWGGTGTCGATLAAGASCTYSAKFTPTANGARTGAIVVTDNAPSSPQTISLTGTGGTVSGAAISVSPASLTFATYTVGTSSAVQSVTVTNTGNATLTMSAALSGDYGWGGIGTCGTSLAAGASCTDSVAFSPTASGTRTGTLTISSNATNGTKTVSLTGTGTGSSGSGGGGGTVPPCGSGCNNYYVSASGSDSNSGTSASSPWKTIAHADSALTLGSGGTIVHVAPGTYSGPITTNKAGTASARIVWLSDTRWGAKVTTSNWSVNGAYTDVNGFDMTSPATGNNYCIGTGASDAVHILNNYCHDFVIADCGQFGVVNVGTGGDPNPNSHDVWVIGNVIRHAGNYNFTGPFISHCVTLHGIYDHGIRTVIENNIISGITGWGIKKNMSPGGGGPNVISNNTIFNNGGGIVFTEQVNSGALTTFDYNAVNNNIIVNNGVDEPGGGRFGLDYYHVTGTHNVVSNNLIYGNKPSDYAHHDVACVGGTPISGSDADGTAGGCPSVNAKSDSGGTDTTFANFQFDGPSAPASNYNSANYQLKAGSSAVQGGTTSCAASPGLHPCTPSQDFNGNAYTNPPSIGAYR